MANPFLGEQYPNNMVSDHYGDTRHHQRCNGHVAGLLFLALGVIVLMHVAGFRAMVGVGR